MHLRSHNAYSKEAQLYSRVSNEKILKPFLCMPRHSTPHVFEYMEGNFPCHGGIMALQLGIHQCRFFFAIQCDNLVSFVLLARVACLFLVFNWNVGEPPPQCPSCSKRLEVVWIVLSNSSRDSICVLVSPPRRISFYV
jgi:hypothetical protein